jgi:hypothetical protein
MTKHSVAFLANRYGASGVFDHIHKPMPSMSLLSDVVPSVYSPSVVYRPLLRWLRSLQTYTPCPPSTTYYNNQAFS